MGSAGSAAPRKFEGKSSFGRKYWSLEEKHRKLENNQIRNYLSLEEKHMKSENNQIRNYWSLEEKHR